MPGGREMGVNPESQIFKLPRLDDEELGYDTDEPTVENKMTFDQMAGEINSGDNKGEKTRVIPMVDVDPSLMDGERTRISKRFTDKTQLVDLGSLGEDDDGKNGETAIVNLPKRKN